jgi:hypothetical protein
MSETTQDMILAEVRALRSDFNRITLDTGARLSTLESQMHDICGNGQPGRLSQVETEVRGLDRWRWRMIGICTGVSATVSALAYLVFHR